MIVHEPKQLTVNNFSFSQNLSSFDKHSRQLTDIGGDSIGFGCEDIDLAQVQSNEIDSLELVSENQTSLEITELIVEKSLSSFDKYSRQLTDIGGDGIGFGCEDVDLAQD